MKSTILIIDDEEKLRSLLKRIITLEGYRVLEAATLKAATKTLEKEWVDVVLCDVKLPDGNGIDFTKTVKEKFPAIEIILLTAFGNIPDGVEAIQNGAFNYITKGDDNARILPLLQQAVEKRQLKEKIARLEERVGKKYDFSNVLGSSPLLKEAIQLATIVAPNTTTVLLLGETGTGKEVFAQAIHNASPRSLQPFVAINCSSFSKELLESEIFGYKAGAFTSAVKDKKGLIEEADKGSLFLDEIGEMPLELQSKLLRVLETNEFIKLGETKTTRVDVRFIAATNRDLHKEAAEGRFREDLFYRLNVYSIKLPALRERKQDIPLLAKFFIAFFAEKINVPVPEAGAEFMERLQQYPWKGNIRELKNCIERAMIVANGATLTIAHLPAELRELPPDNTQTLSAFDLHSAEKLHIQRVLNHTKYNKAEAARLLNIGLATLYRKIDDYQLHE
ncbi:MAG TPA: sigma-54 dependent transcriptional regulator [Chitinophagaceae bacterium]|nr:sigma-54 dependent transcriptional regulator [Chitinophagaceae bacterium]